MLQSKSVPSSGQPDSYKVMYSNSSHAIMDKTLILEFLMLLLYVLFSCGISSLHCCATPVCLLITRHRWIHTSPFPYCTGGDRLSWVRNHDSLAMDQSKPNVWAWSRSSYFGDTRTPPEGVRTRFGTTSASSAVLRKLLTWSRSWRHPSFRWVRFLLWCGKLGALLVLDTWVWYPDARHHRCHSVPPVYE